MAGGSKDMERDNRDSGLPLSENFDGLSLTGAKIFTFEICLENYTNFKDFFLFRLVSFYLPCLFQRGLAFCVHELGLILDGYFGGGFWGSF